MKMSRGHFEALARALAESRPAMDGTHDGEVARAQWFATTMGIVELCHEMSNLTPNGNRAFDEARFLTACGFQDRTGVSA